MNICHLLTLPLYEVVLYVLDINIFLLSSLKSCSVVFMYDYFSAFCDHVSFFVIVNICTERKK